MYIQVLVIKGQLQADKLSKPHSWLKIKQYKTKKAILVMSALISSGIVKYIDFIIRLLHF